MRVSFAIPGPRLTGDGWRERQALRRSEDQGGQGGCHRASLETQNSQRRHIPQAQANGALHCLCHSGIIQPLDRLCRCLSFFCTNCSRSSLRLCFVDPGPWERPQCFLPSGSRCVCQQPLVSREPSQPAPARPLLLRALVSGRQAASISPSFPCSIYPSRFPSLSVLRSLSLFGCRLAWLLMLLFSLRLLFAL